MKPLILALISIAAAIVSASASAAPAHAGATRNVVLVVADGVRWQEVFTGADPKLLNDDDPDRSWITTEVLRKKYWRDDVKERRKVLLPFIWGTVAQHGQIFGNRALGSNATVSNGQAFSYPGYDELLTGKVNPHITTNEFGPNPSVTVFEWLSLQKDFSDRLAVFGSWEVFQDIFNVSRSKLPVYCGPSVLQAAPGAAHHDLFAELFRTTTRLDADDPADSFVQVALLDYLKVRQPRALFVGYGEPDNWAHSGRYDLVMASLQNFDYFVGQLWATLQSMPAYRDQTTLIITTDHGRGGGLKEWKEHGVDEKGSENIWIAVMGPDTPALGERQKTSPVIQAQIAATLAAFVGQDYHAAVPGVAAPLPDVLKP